MRHEDEIDYERALLACSSIARIRVPREKLVVAAIDEDHLALRSFEDEAIPLLDIDHGEAKEAARPFCHQ